MQLTVSLVLVYISNGGGIYNIGNLLFFLNLLFSRSFSKNKEVCTRVSIYMYTLVLSSLFMWLTVKS